MATTIPSSSTSVIPLWRSGVVAALGVLTIALCLLSPAAMNSDEAGVNLSLPNGVGRYWGQNQEISEAERVILPPDTEFARKIYRNMDGDQILCSIVLSGAEKRSIHRPEVCLPGQGWTLKSGEVVPVTLPSGHVLQIMNLSVSRQVQVSDTERRTINSYFMYWFVGRDKTTPYHWQRVLLSSWDRVIHNINHRWAYVIVQAYITEGLQPNGKNADQTLEIMKNFIQQATPTFQKSEIKAGFSQGIE